MSWLTEWQRRWQFWRDRERRESELAEEMAFHREQSAGKFGSTAYHTESARGVWIPRLWDELATDVGYALRGLRKSPGFAAVAVGTLALGIGAGTAIFSLAQAVMLRPLPYREADRLFLIFEGMKTQTSVRGDTSPGTFGALREDLRSARDLAVFGRIERDLTEGAEPERVSGGTVSANFFQTVGVQPYLGRGFAAGEDQPGKPAVVVLSYELWQRRYGGDRALVGREIRLDEKPHTVIGVMPEGFSFVYDRFQLWTPFVLTPELLANRGARYVYVAGRLANHAAIGDVQAELDTLAERYRRDFPRDASLMKLQAIGVHDRLAEGSRTSLQFLLAAVVALLLIACSNVANLLLTRSVARESELAVRRALGAGSGRLLRQLLTESLVIALLAGAMSLAVAAAAFRLLQPLVPVGLARFTVLGLDWGVVAMMLALAVVSTALSGWLPSIRAARSLTTRSVGGQRHEWTRGALVVSEVAMAIVLLTGAGLLFRTFTNLRAVHPGFVPEGLVSAQVRIEPRYVKEPELRLRFYADVLERVRALPGVENAAFASAVPTTWKGGNSSFTPEGRAHEPGLMVSVMRQVTPGYLDTLRIRLRAGRWLQESDGVGTPLVAVINEKLASRIWPGENPLGRKIQRGDGRAERPWVVVVGVVEDVLEMGLNAEAPMITYLPAAQYPAVTFTTPQIVLARTATQTTLSGRALREAISQVSRHQVLAQVGPVTEVLAKETAEIRIQSAISVTFGALALVLACLGTYSVLAYAVSQRKREFGVRLALGATPLHLAAGVTARGMKLVLAGAALGVALAVPLSRYLESMLFQVKPADPLTLVAVVLALGLTALVACWIPARRALRIDPGEALRHW